MSTYPGAIVDETGHLTQATAAGYGAATRS